ncbi:MAG: peptide-methionine (R)-S-oxide reductase MsrB [Myxococcales bacterium]|nr:peptide-methionine (R)-S-oxide reductase MsrB [Myxococcales bacterium]
MKDPAIDTTIDPRALTEAEWAEILSSLEFQILRQSGTERAGTGPYLAEERAGSYHCAGCGQKLYGGATKFHSGCGWPSFFQEIEPGALTKVRDTSHGMVRTEMRCSRCDGHLSHIFDDAPHQPTGLRHCVNGFALVFVPKGESVQEAFRSHRARRSRS